MRFGTLLAVILMIGSVAQAHPGIGIVIDTRGNVFYTDLAQVWRIAPDGTKSIAVRGVHTHELCLDSADNLYGEHLWYEGDATKKWGHRVWRRSPGGGLVDVIPTREGFRRDYSFVRDASGNMYWAESSRGILTGPTNNVDLVRKRTPDGAISTLALWPFSDVRWMTVTPAGVVYLIDATDLLRITTAGRVDVVVRHLSHSRMIRPDISDRHLVMGIWTDRAGNVYAADYGNGEVKQVSPAGAVRVVARSHLPWSVTGGVCGPDGDLWLLEYSVTNAVRVRRIGRDGRERIY